MMIGPASRRRLLRLAIGRASTWAAVCVACVVAGCGGEPAAKTPVDAGKKESDEAKIARWMARETPELPPRKVSLLGGLIEGTIEGEGPPKMECDPTGTETCVMQTSLGKDSEGDPVSILCSASADTPNFGYVIRKALDGAGLVEMPAIAAGPAGKGFAIAFVANSRKADETGTRIGTTKVAALYSQNYAVACFDVGSGNRKTFARIIDKYFESLAFKPHPKRPALLAQGRIVRQGDQIMGMRYSYIEKRGDDKPGTDETSRAFVLETDGSSWNHIDHSSSVLRDAGGGTERTIAVFSANGQALVALTSKPAEDAGKLRLKAEVGGKTESIELSPKEQLSTEIWSAPQLLRVSRGERSTHKYGTLDINEDREPAFAYATVTKKAAGTLEETIQNAREPKGDAGPEKNELQLDDEGFVKKQVSDKAIIELAYKWGALPKEASAPQSVGPKSK